MTARAGLLHTVPALAASFTAAIDERMPGVELVHVVDPALLATAVREGVTDGVRAEVAAHIAYLAARTDAVLVTCSSIGEAVEAAAPAVAVPVLRVDAPMADEAVRLAAAAGEAGGRSGRIVVLATLTATLGPTGRLVERAAAAAGAAVDVTARVVDGAAALRSRGELAAHDALIAAAVEGAVREADVIVLAQASMAQAAAATASVPVLTSPAGGVASLVAALGG